MQKLQLVTDDLNLKTKANIQLFAELHESYKNDNLDHRIVKSEGNLFAFASCNSRFPTAKMSSVDDDQVMTPEEFFEAHTG